MKKLPEGADSLVLEASDSRAVEVKSLDSARQRFTGIENIIKVSRFFQYCISNLHFLG